LLLIQKKVVNYFHRGRNYVTRFVDMLNEWNYVTRFVDMLNECKHMGKSNSLVRVTTSIPSFNREKLTYVLRTHVNDLKIEMFYCNMGKSKSIFKLFIN
jgi:hypothetical protein